MGPVEGEPAFWNGHQSTRARIRLLFLTMCVACARATNNKEKELQSLSGGNPTSRYLRVDR
jgi:hypothetical protein